MTKPLFQKLPLSKGSSFLYERYESPYFETPLHYHEEFEIVLCDGGFGKKIIGNHTSDYFENELYLLGSNLPHWFRADEQFYSDKNQEKPASLVIQFRLGSFGEHFFELIEMEKIASLFEQAKFGLVFFGETKDQINDLIRENIYNSGLKKLETLISILDLMANTDEKTTLSEISMVGLSIKDSERMNIIYEIVFRRFNEEISIDEVAEKTKLSKPAFCRYFKARTQKTFVEFLNQVRLNNACKLLIERDLSIIEVCFECGFNNLSNFNRQFKNEYNLNPRAFRVANKIRN